MPLIRIDASADRPVAHDRSRPVDELLAEHLQGTGPVVVMIHGYKYQPGDPGRCPHRHIHALPSEPARGPSDAWPWPLGFGRGDRDEGLAIAFGWNARGWLHQAHDRAALAGRALAKALAPLHAANPSRPIHVIAHSLGVEPALEALHHLPAGAVDRMIALTGASYRSRTEVALKTPAGRKTTFINVTSRENALFDRLFEWLVPAPCDGDRAIGDGLTVRNAVTLRLDCPRVLVHLQHCGFPVAPPLRHVCHWSGYTRPGVMRLYRALLRNPAMMARLRAGLPAAPVPAPWQLPIPRAVVPALPFARKA